MLWPHPCPQPLDVPDCLPVLGGLLQLTTLPGERDGVLLAVLDGKVSHPERGRQDGTLQGATLSHRLVRVQSRAGLFSKHTHYKFFNFGDTTSATDDFHRIDVVWAKFWNKYHHYYHR